MAVERTISSRLIYQGRIVNLRVDTVVLPSGRTSTREIVEHRGAVAMLAVDDQRRVLLVRQFRKPIERELLEIPAGTLDPGEDPLAAAHRELLEETGYTARRMERIAGFYSAPGFCTEYLHVYLATELTGGVAQPEEDEVLSVVPVPLEAAWAMVDRGEICDAKSLIGLLTLRARAQELLRI